MASAVLFFLLGAAAGAEPKLVGVLTSCDEWLVGLAAHDGAPIGWHRMGEQVDGYTLLEYQPATESLVMRGADGTVVLRLNEGRTLRREEVLAVAAREITSRENWSSAVNYEPLRSFKGNWLIVAHHDAGGMSATRILVLTPSGAVRNYVRSALSR